MKKLLITGSSGLIGSEVSVYFAGRGWSIHGVDNNQRACSLDPKVTRAGTKNVLNLFCQTSFITNMTYEIETALRD
ncbi:MAG: NAD-dependent epimerase/dehydratase family protein [Pirellulaceae bacterium]